MNEEQQREFDKAYTPEQYTQTTYSFTTGELREIQSYESIVKLAQLAQAMINSVINNVVLKRVGVKNSPDVGLLYSMEKGEIYVKIPKFWCQACQNKKAEFKYADKNYCPNCIEVIKKQQLEKQVEKVELVEKKGKK